MARSSTIPFCYTNKIVRVVGQIEARGFYKPFNPYHLLSLLNNIFTKDCFYCCKKFQNVNTLTILVLGKGGVGKSSTINSLIGEQVVRVNAFQVSIAFICSFAFLA